MYSIFHNLWLLILIVVSLITKSCCYIIIVDVDTEECFFENLEADTKFGVTFDVTEGGFLDIDLKIVGPNGALIHHGEKENSGMYTFSAPTAGRYTYCFNNQFPTIAKTPKVVMFNIEIGKDQQNKENDKDKAVNHNNLLNLIKKLGSTLKTVKQEQEYKQILRTHQIPGANTEYYDANTVPALKREIN